MDAEDTADERSPSDEGFDDIAAARAGDVAALARMYDRHAAVVLSICRRYGRGAGETGAEDAMQETFVRACRMLDTIDDPRRVRSWLVGIARRVCAERRRGDERRGRRERAVAARSASDSAAHPRDATTEHEDLDQLGAALDALPEKERLAIHLHYLDPDSPQTTQANLGVSRSGFYKLLSRARERLAALMTGEHDARDTLDGIGRLEGLDRLARLDRLDRLDMRALHDAHRANHDNSKSKKRPKDSSGR